MAMLRPIRQVRCRPFLQLSIRSDLVVGKLRQRFAPVTHPIRVDAKQDGGLDEIAEQLRKQGLGTNVLLAILAKAGMRLTADEEQSHG